MSTIRLTGRFLAALCAAALGLGGCTVDRERQAQGQAGLAASLYSSPAKAKIRAGFAEMVLTNRRWPSFEEASANRVMALTDGSPLYANIRAATRLGDVALPAEPYGRYTFSAYPRLVLQVGNDKSLDSLTTCYVTLSPEETRQRELVVPLAPHGDRPGGNPADCWLDAAAMAKPAKQVYEIRLGGFAGRIDAWLPVADLLAVESVVTDYTGGVAAYAAMLEAAPPPVTQVAEAAPVPTPTPEGAQAAPPTTEAAPVARPSTTAAPAASRAPETIPAPEAAQVAGPLQPTTPLQVAGPIAAPAPASSTGRATAPEPANARIVIHYHSADPAALARARELQARLMSRRDFDVEVRPVSAIVSVDNIRIYFEADRENALHMRDLDSSGPMPIRDFREFRPLPSPGTIEVWLAASV